MEEDDSRQLVGDKSVDGIVVYDQETPLAVEFPLVTLQLLEPLFVLRHALLFLNTFSNLVSFSRQRCLRCHHKLIAQSRDEDRISLVRW